MQIKEFSKTVDEVLIRHKSILDIMTKLQETSAKINRAIAKAATECGCIRICADKQVVNPEVDYSQLDEYMQSQIQGKLCPTCLAKIQEEMGDNLFYLVSLCNALDMDLEQVLAQKHDALKTLGKYSLF